MSKKIYVYISILFILLIGLSALSAENVTSDDKNINIQADNGSISSTTTNTTSNVKSISKQDNSQNNIKYNYNKINSSSRHNLKSGPDKNPMQLSINNYTCKQDEIVHVKTYMNPEGVTDGVLMYSLDDDLLGTCNIRTVGTEFDIDTYGYELGEHTLTVDFTASLTYESARATSTLTIYKDVHVSSTDTNLVNGIYSVYPSNVTIYSDDDTAHGDIELYINDVLVETYSDVVWNNLNVSIPDIKIVNKYPVIPEYVNSAGNYTWKLVFKSNNGYNADNNITGTLEMMDHVEITLMDNLSPCYPYEYVDFEFMTRPGNLLGAILISNDGMMITAEAVKPGNNIISDRITLNPGEYLIYANYEADVATDSYYTEHGINPAFKYHTYPQSQDSNYVTLTVLKVPVSLRLFNTDFDQNNNLYFTMDLSSYDNVFDKYYEGMINVYSDGTLIKSIDLYDFNDASLEYHSVINFTLDKSYNNKNLRFEFTDMYDYYDDMVFDRLINAEKKDITLTTPSNMITANVGDLVEIPYSFNDTRVNDGTISISYGGSIDNTTLVTSNSGVIGFDTSDYLQGEYDLVLRYYDSSVYEEKNIPLTLELYQPTSIIADCEDLEVILGEGNEYVINFTTSRDSWDDVIWGSIDVYVDDNIVSTIIVDDETGNKGSVTLDDYNLEDLAPGNHTLKAVFTTDDAYILTSQTSVNLNVGGEVTIDLPETVNAVMYDNYNITPVVVRFNGKIIKQGNLSFIIDTVNNFKIDLNSFNNTITRNASYDTGIYNVTVRYHDEENTYPDTSTSFTLIVRTDSPAHFSTAYDTTITTDVYIGLRDNRGRLINRTVNITLPDGSKIENAEINSTFLYRFTLSYIPYGENTVTVEAEENLTYTSLNQSYTFNVSKVKTNISGAINRKIVNNTYGTFRLKMNQINHHDNIANATIKIINLETDEVIGTGITANNGITSIVTNISHHGDYQLKVVYEGDEFFESNELYLNITVPKLVTNTYINVNNQTLGNTSIEVYVRNPKDNNIIPNAPLTIILPDNTQINSNTGETGIITIPLNLSVGDNNITVEFAGYDEYNSSRNTETITVTQRESIITATITNNTVNNVTINITVADKINGQQIPNGNIEVVDKDGNIIGQGSIKDGQASITTTITDKNITELTIKYLGNTNYTTSNITLTGVEIVGRLSNITYKIINSTHENVTVNITVNDPVTNTPIANIPVLVTYPDGTSEELTTDDYGNISVSPDLNVGENTIHVEVKSNDIYNGTTSNITFTVNMRESQTTAKLNNNTLQNTTITAQVTDKITGKTITSGNIEVIDTATSRVVGRATLTDDNPVNITINIETIESYNLSVEYKGNTNYTSSNYILENVNITKRESKVNINI